MTHPIDAKLNELQRRARRLARWFGICAFATLLLATLLSIAWLDHVWRYREALFRYLGFGILGLTTVFAFQYLLWPALRYRPKRLTLAQRLESLYPSLRDRLTSAVAFLDASPGVSSAETLRDESHSGRLPKPSKRMTQSGSKTTRTINSRTMNSRTMNSTAMQNAVIAQANELIQQVSRARVLNATATYVAAGLAIVCLMTLLIWASIDREGSRIAIQRSLVPWATIDWPKRNQLEFDPRLEVVRRGSTVEFRVIDRRGSLPEFVQLEVADANRDSVVTYEMTRHDDKAVYFLEQVQGDLLVRASGGDDRTAWLPLRVVDAPSLVTRTVSIQPPDYLGIEPITTSGAVQAWAGSLISWEGTVDRPIESATLVIRTGQAIRRRVLEIDATRTHFFLAAPPWHLDEPAMYQLEWVDEEGVVGKLDEPVAMQIVTDRPPEIDISVQAWQQVTTLQGVVPYYVQARDDVKLRDGRLSIATSTTTLLEQELAVRETNIDGAPGEDSDSENESLSGLPNSSSDLAVMPQLIEHSAELRLSQFQQLKVGDQIVFRGVAEDALGQVGRQGPIQLTVVSAEEYLERLSALELQIQERLNEALQSQRRAIRWLSEMQSIADQPDAFLQRVDELDYSQRQLSVSLSDGSGGATHRSRELVNWLQWQQLLDTALGQRAQRCQNELRELRSGLLSELQPTMDRWLQVAESEGALSLPDAATLRQDCQRTIDTQLDVVSTLESLIELMGQSRKVRGIIDQLRQIQVDQDAFASDLNAFQLRRLQDTQLEREETRDIQFALEQDQIAERLNRLLNDVATYVSESKGSGEELRRFEELVIAAERLQVVGAMRDASAQIREARLGRALSMQSPIQESLAQLLAIARQGESLSQPQLQEMSDAQKRLKTAINQQQQIATQLEAFQRRLVSGEPIREEERRELLEQQDRVGDLLGEVADRLEGTPWQSTAQRLREIARSLQRSVEAAVAEPNQANVAAVQKELTDLQQIAQGLDAKLAAQVQQQFEQERLQWVEELRALRERQQLVLDEAIRLLPLEGAIDEQSQRNLDRLRLAQTELPAEVRDMLEQPTTIPTLVLILEQVALEMERAESAMRNPATAPRSMASMRSAIRLIQDVLEALEPPEPSPEQTSSDPINDQDPQPPRTSQSASLRTIRILQQYVYEQTVELEQKFANEAAPRRREDEIRLAELGQTQRLLIELVQEMEDDIRASIDETRQSQEKATDQAQPPLQIPLPGIDRD